MTKTETSQKDKNAKRKKKKKNNAVWKETSPLKKRKQI